MLHYIQRKVCKTEPSHTDCGELATGVSPFVMVLTEVPSCPIDRDKMMREAEGDGGRLQQVWNGVIWGGGGGKWIWS